ncbi:hypothetical protein L9F63_024636, partial [Diploptera punctata]
HISMLQSKDTKPIGTPRELGFQSGKLGYSTNVSCCWSGIRQRLTPEIRTFTFLITSGRPFHFLKQHTDWFYHLARSCRDDSHSNAVIETSISKAIWHQTPVDSHQIMEKFNIFLIDIYLRSILKLIVENPQGEKKGT